MVVWDMEHPDALNECRRSISLSFGTWNIRIRHNECRRAPRRSCYVLGMRGFGHMRLPLDLMSVPGRRMAGRSISPPNDELNCSTQRGAQLLNPTRSSIARLISPPNGRSISPRLLHGDASSTQNWLEDACCLNQLQFSGTPYSVDYIALLP